MKTKILILSFFALLISTTLFSQNPASSVSIPVQGIARDDNNTARINTDVDFTFEFYYLVTGTEYPILSPIVQTLTTDAFGVFSTRLELGGDKSYLMANNQTYLRIKEGDTVISNEILNHVPYAVAANNGVPTGSIMPFVGATAPAGWLLCNGDLIPAGTDYQPLRDILAEPDATNVNTPNLEGMFLRGAGQYDEDRIGPALGEIQEDAYKRHKHGNDFEIESGGNHRHQLQFGLAGSSVNDGTLPHYSDAIIEQYDDLSHLPVDHDNNPSTPDETIYSVKQAGTHTHVIEGEVLLSSDAESGSETRPINYGVNYIIKL